MSIAKKPTRVQYMCSYCGKKETHSTGMGRPMPGKCPRKSGNRPHSWIISRKY